MSAEAHSKEGCYADLCTCSCGETDRDFDEIIQKETKFEVTLDALCRSNIGWFGDKTVSDHFLADWNIAAHEGIYLLWHKDGYCACHERHHLRCLYVGKGDVPLRLATHHKAKDFSSEMLVYWTYLPMPNRQAKYVEQLILDLYSIPLNKYETKGTRRLCVHLKQEEVD